MNLQGKHNIIMGGGKKKLQTNLLKLDFFLLRLCSEGDSCI